MISRFSTFLSLNLILASISAHAEIVKLFHVVQGRVEQVLNYNELVRNLATGDWIEFSDGKKFQIQEILGQGEMTQVWSLASDKTQAIRIPLHRDSFDPIMGPHAPTRFMNKFIDGSTPLEQAKVSTVRILESKMGEYAVVERLAPVGQQVLTLKKFLTQSALKTPEEKQMAAKVIDFARSVAPFESIGDFKAEQVGWDPRTQQWKLMDWSDSHVLYSPHSKHVFTSPFYSLRIENEEDLAYWALDTIYRSHQEIEKTQNILTLFPNDPALHQTRALADLGGENFGFSDSSSKQKSCMSDFFRKLFESH